LEAAAGYGALSHGEAVAIGVRFACSLAQRKQLLGSSDRRRADALMEALALPARPSSNLDIDAVVGFLGRDKKTRGDVVQFVLPIGRGRSQVVDLALADVEQEARRFLGG
jgi:3-dehydroquinate synthase